MTKLRDHFDFKISIMSILEKLAPWLIAPFGGTAGVILAKLTTWLSNVGPIGYGAIFIAGAYLTIGVYHAILSARKKSLLLQYASLISRPGDGNPLETKFDKKTIRLNDFFTPYHTPHTKKIFESCEIVGPGNFAMIGCTLNHISLISCQIVITNRKQPIMNITAFQDCTFLNSKIIGCTIFIPDDQYIDMPDLIKQTIPVLNGNIA